MAYSNRIFERAPRSECCAASTMLADSRTNLPSCPPQCSPKPSKQGGTPTVGASLRMPSRPPSAQCPPPRPLTKRGSLSNLQDRAAEKAPFNGVFLFAISLPIKPRVPSLATQIPHRRSHPHFRRPSVEKFVDYFPESPEESSFLYLVNLNPILISDVTPYLSIRKPRVDAPSLSWALHFLMPGPNRCFPQSIMNRR